MQRQVEVGDDLVGHQPRSMKRPGRKHGKHSVWFHMVVSATNAPWPISDTATEFVLRPCSAIVQANGDARMVGSGRSGKLGRGAE